LTGQKELKTALICEHLDKETQHGTVMIQWKHQTDGLFFKSADESDEEIIKSI
jgi:hypothetical protein